MIQLKIKYNFNIKILHISEVHKLQITTNKLPNTLFVSLLETFKKHFTSQLLKLQEVNCRKSYFQYETHNLLNTLV